MGSGKCAPAGNDLPFIYFKCAPVSAKSTLFNVSFPEVDDFVLWTTTIHMHAPK